MPIILVNFCRLNISSPPDNLHPPQAARNGEGDGGRSAKWQYTVWLRQTDDCGGVRGHQKHGRPDRHRGASSNLTSQ